MMNQEKIMTKNKKIFVTVICCLALLAVGISVFFIVRNAKKSTLVKNVTYTVKSETIEHIIEISGNIEAAESQTLQAQGDGTVRKVNFKEGDTVKKGDVIIVLDSDEEDYNISKHDWDYTKAKANNSAPKELELMRKQREMLLKKLEKRQVIARIDGIIVGLDAAVEDYCEAKDEVGTIIDRSYLKAEVEVAETDAPQLKKGQKVVMTFPSYSGEIIGEIVSVPAKGTITSRGASVVMAQIHVANPPDEILPGYSFTGKIQIKESDTVLVVEKAAIGRENRQQFAEVVKADGSTERVNVRAVPYDMNYLKIVEGLEEGMILKNQGQSTSGTKAGTTGAFGMPGMGVPGNSGRGASPAGSAPKGK
jgi:multidrug efflux pump subunit AcrA (membrane-fusion protein)